MNRQAGSADDSSRCPVLAAACTAHFVQDGLVALQFVFLPVLSASLGLGYAQVGVLKAIASVAMAVTEVPSGLLAENCRGESDRYSGPKRLSTDERAPASPSCDRTGESVRM